MKLTHLSDPILLETPAIFVKRLQYQSFIQTSMYENSSYLNSNNRFPLNSLFAQALFYNILKTKSSYNQKLVFILTSVDDMMQCTVVFLFL